MLNFIFLFSKSIERDQRHEMGSQISRIRSSRLSWDLRIFLIIDFLYFLKTQIVQHSRHLYAYASFMKENDMKKILKHNTDLNEIPESTKSYFQSTISKS